MGTRVIIQAEPREGTVVLTVHDGVGEHGTERRFVVTADQLWSCEPAEELHGGVDRVG